MKITKQQLRKIIKEEKQKLLQENREDNLSMIATVIDNLTEMALGYEVDEETKTDLLSQVELLQGVYSSMYDKTTGYRRRRR